MLFYDSRLELWAGENVVGVVVDPIGMAIGLAIGVGISAAFDGPITGPVSMYGAFFATHVVTEAKGMGPILIPPGTMWVPMPEPPKPSFKGPPDFPGLPVKTEDDVIAIMGSKTVNVMGASQVRMGEMWMSCGEPLRAPSSVVIAVPKGGPVLAGGPSAVNLLTALTSMIKTKWVAGYLHSLLDELKPGRLRNVLHWVACKLTGHPVDVASGRVITNQVEWELPGPLPLRFELVHFSSWCNRFGPLGHGWSHSLDEVLWSECGKIVYMTGDGREIEFDTFDFPEHKLPPGARLFDPVSRLTLVLDGRGGATVTSHDGVRREYLPIPGTSGVRKNWLRLKRVADRAGNSIDIDYDKKGKVIFIMNSLGQTITYYMNAIGLVTKVVNPHGACTSYEYDKRTLAKVKETGPLGEETCWIHDERGNCCQTVLPDGSRTQSSFDDQNRLVRFVDAMAGEWEWQYDTRGLPTQRLAPGGGEQTFTWNQGLLESRRLAPDRRLAFGYDAQRNLTTVTLPNGGQECYSIDNLGRIVQITNAGGGETRIVYDPAGRVVETRTPAGTIQQLTHDCEDNLLEVKDDTRRRRFGRTRDRVVWQEEAGVRTQFVWNTEGRLTAIVNEHGERFEIVLDAAGNVSEEVGLTTGDIVQGAYLDFGNSGMGLMVEAKLMRRNSFGSNPNLLNDINSPGEKMLKNAKPAELAAVKAHADALEQDFQHSQGRICK